MHFDLLMRVWRCTLSGRCHCGSTHLVVVPRTGGAHQLGCGAVPSVVVATRLQWSLSFFYTWSSNQYGDITQFVNSSWPGIIPPTVLANLWAIEVGNPYTGWIQGVYLPPITALRLCTKYP